MSTQYDIFLSYARADEKTASALQVRLEEKGLRCWRDRDNISPIEYFFPQSLAQAIDSSRVAIAILSSAYVSSYYCLQEFVNCRVDQQLSNSKIRLFTTDATLISHPLVEASGNQILGPDDVDSELVYTWIRQFRADSPRQGDFAELSAELLSHLSHQPISEDCRNYKDLVLAPLIEVELINRALSRKELRGTHERLTRLQGKVEHATKTPEFLRQAVRSRLAYSNYIVGNYDEALSIRLDDYIAGIKSRGATDFTVMQDADMLVQCLHRAGRVDEAESLAQQNLSLAKTHFGPDHEFTVGILSSLAGIYCDSGRYSDAIPYAKAAYNAKHQSLSPSSDEWRSIVMNYAFLLMRTGDPGEALPLLAKVFAVYKSDCGLDNIDTAQAEIKLAECHLRLENGDLADTHAQSAMRAFSQLDLAHPLRAHGAVVAIQCAYSNSNLEAQQLITQEHIDPLIAEGGDLADQVSRFVADNPEYFAPVRTFEAMDSMMSNWASLSRKGFRTVSIEDSSTQSCGVCVHVEASASHCPIHNLSINCESWSCPNFAFTGDSRIEGEVPDFVWRSLPLTVDIALDGANAGDADCQFIVGVLCAHRALHQIVRDRLAKDLAIDPKAAYEVCSRELSSNHWFSLAALSNNSTSVGAKLARRMLDRNTPREDLERNVAAFWKYSDDFLQKSEYFCSL